MRWEMADELEITCTIAMFVQHGIMALIAKYVLEKLFTSRNR